MPAIATRRTRAKPPQERFSAEDKLLAAMERLLEQGHKFGAVSVEQLCEEAGIARATFYLHFRDRGELVARLMGRVTGDIVQSAGLWFQNADRAEPQDIQQAMRGIIGAFKKHQAVVAAIADTAGYDQAVADLHEKMMEQLCAESRRAIAGVRLAGKASPQATPELADMLTWLVELYCSRFISRYSDMEIEPLADLLAHVCASAIFGAAPGAGKSVRGKTG